jgi:hypothetical protein
MSLFRSIVVSLMMMLGLVGLPITSADTAFAANKAEVCKGVAAVGGQNTCNDPSVGNGLGEFLEKIINILLFIIGAIAVLMIIIGGIRYVLSAGDQNAVTGAKNTILYAVVGLVVAIMAYAIVNFVLKSI